MHPEARDFVARTVDGRHFERAVELGSRYINGRVRDLVDAGEYLGLDHVEGQDVDVVADVTEWRTRRKYDLVVCCEVLEHVEDPEAVVETAVRALRKGGTLVLTCATADREPHSAVDGGPLRDDEHYSNVNPDDLHDWVEDRGLRVENLEVHRDRGDLYLEAVLE